jgi:selenocysteine-specific elongation factor
MDVGRELDVARRVAQELFDDLKARGDLIELGVGPRQTAPGRWVHHDVLAAIAGRAEGTLRQLHREASLEARVPRQRLARRLAGVDPAVLDAVLDRMIASGALAGDQAEIGLPAFKPQMTEAQRTLRDRLLSAFAAAGFNPPDPLEVARAARVPEAQCRSILELCVHDGGLVHLEGSLYLHRAWEVKLRDLVKRKLQAGARLTVAEIRDLLGTTRKFAVPFCEHLDRVGVTRREGDVRVGRD